MDKMLNTIKDYYNAWVDARYNPYKDTNIYYYALVGAIYEFAEAYGLMDLVKDRIGDNMEQYLLDQMSAEDLIVDLKFGLDMLKDLNN